MMQPVAESDLGQRGGRPLARLAARAAGRSAPAASRSRAPTSRPGGCRTGTRSRPPARRYRASAASPRAKRSSPWKSTRPAEGRSSAPSRCSSVDLPTPEAPTSATTSPTPTVIEAPPQHADDLRPGRGTRARAPRPRAAARFDGDPRYSYRNTSTGWSEPARRAGMIVAKKDSTSVAPTISRKSVGRQLHRQVVDLIDVAGQPDDLVRVLHPDDGEPHQAAGQRADHADRHAHREEDGRDRASRWRRST